MYIHIRSMAASAPCLWAWRQAVSAAPTHTTRARPPPFANPQSRPSLFARFASSLTSSDKRSHYDILGIASTASAGEIKKKFYDLSKQLHPDRNRTLPAEERKVAAKKYGRVKEAYDVLKDKSKRAAFDQELSGRNGSSGGGGGFSGGDSVYHTQRNARSNDHYYGHTRYTGSAHQASSFYRKSTARQQHQPHSYYQNKHTEYKTQRSTRHATDTDPLHARYQTGSNYDVPHFDFDRHYKQQRGYDNHRKIQIIKQAQRRMQEEQQQGHGFAPGESSTFRTDQDFIHHHHNPYSKPTKHMITLTGPGLAFLGCGGAWLIYLLITHVFS